MKFNYSFKGTSKRKITSGEVRKLLSAEGFSVKEQKKIIRNAIQTYNAIHAGKTWTQVSGPNVNVVASSVRKKKDKKKEEISDSVKKYLGKEAKSTKKPKKGKK